MKQHKGIWLPDHEEHLVGWIDANPKQLLPDGRPFYQGFKQKKALEAVKNFRVAVDVGAHCGLWSMHLAQKFQQVHAFEPVAAHRECFLMNVGSPTTVLYPYALGDQQASVAIKTTLGSSGDSSVEGAGDIPMKRLDDFDLLEVDFIKIDCEGFELNVLKGAEETLVRWHPALVVEQKPGNAQSYGLEERGAIPYLESLGAKLWFEYSGDFFFSWD